MSAAPVEVYVVITTKVIPVPLHDTLLHPVTETRVFWSEEQAESYRQEKRGQLRNRRPDDRHYYGHTLEKVRIEDDAPTVKSASKN
jgi:hypothetical protein